MCVAFLLNLLDIFDMKIVDCGLPINTLISKSFEKIDYIDAFETKFPFTRKIAPEFFASSFISSFPPWVKKLIILRDCLVIPFGLKPVDLPAISDRLLAPELRVGESIGIFKVFGKSKNEVMFGEDDKHLNFRASFILEHKSGQCNLIVGTTVSYVSRLGRLYFQLIKPFHKIIVKSCIRSTICKLTER